MHWPNRNLFVLSIRDYYTGKIQHVYAAFIPCLLFADFVMVQLDES